MSIKKQVYLTERAYKLAKRFSAIMGSDTFMEFISSCVEAKITELAMDDEALMIILKRELANIDPALKPAVAETEVVG